MQKADLADPPTPSAATLHDLVEDMTIDPGDSWRSWTSDSDIELQEAREAFTPEERPLQAEVSDRHLPLELNHKAAFKDADSDNEPPRIAGDRDMDSTREAVLDMSDITSTIDGKCSDCASDCSCDDHSMRSLRHGAKGEGQQKSAGMGAYWRIFTFADKIDTALYTISIIFAIASGTALPLMNLVFGKFTTDFNNFSSGQGSPEEFRRKVDHTVLYFIYIFAARLGLTYASNLFVSIAAARVTRSLRKAYLENTLRQEVWHFDLNSQASVSTQAVTNGNRINQGIAEKLITLVQGLSLFFSAFVVALATQPVLAIIAMSVVPVLFLIVGGVVTIEARQEAQIMSFYSQAAVLAQDIFGSIKTIHAFNAAEKMVERYDWFLSEAHTIGNRKAPNFGVAFATESFLGLSATALAFWEGYRLFRHGTIGDAGTVITVVLSVALGTTSISQIAPQQIAIANAASAASEMFAGIDKKSLMDPLSEAGKQPPEDDCKGKIEISHLHFAYPSRPTVPVLQGLNLSIPAGKTTALIGPSGCGKSTLIGLLERWYLYESGRITVDGIELLEYNTKWLRSRIGLVQQEPVLFRGTIFENVARGLVGRQLEESPGKLMRRVRKACKQSDAHDFIMKLPQGYETQVGERASMVSGGQRQRLAIARCIISNPKILLLDEATSALDPAAEKVVQAALNKVSRNRTTVVIAHRLSTIKTADSIAVMQQGRVVEQGTHGELMELDACYAAMVRAQDIRSVPEDSGTSLTTQSDVSDHDKEDHSSDQQLAGLNMSPSGPTTTTISVQSPRNLDYGLLKCIYILFLENPNLYWCYAVAGVGCLIGGGTNPAQAVLFSKLINVFTLPPSEAQGQANLLAGMFFVLACANLIGNFGIGWCSTYIGQFVQRRYRREMMECLLNFNMDFFDRPENSSGALTSRLSSVPSSLQELISANIFLMCMVIINTVASSILAIAFGWKLGLVVVFGGLPLLIGSGYIRIRLDQKLEQLTEQRFAESAALAAEAVTSIRTISSLTLESTILKEYADRLDHIVNRTSHSLVITLFPYALSQSVEFLILALGFWYGSRLVANGEYTVTQFFVVFIAVVFGGQSAAQVFGYTTSITKAREAANYILWLRSIKPRIRETTCNSDRGPHGEGAVEMRNVDFAYDQRPDAKVLHGVSVKIEPGNYAAFVGASGCGKSTVISLLERFYDPTSGRILLGDKNIKRYSPRLYRKYMSLVQQEPPLYQGSIRDNITLGLDQAPSEEELREACRQANAWDFICSLPQGLDTPCGSRGTQFSGGQKQRIAIARALIRKPKLLLLDEATSALDSQSEQIVQRAVNEASSGRTIIAVAHRLSTVRQASVIFVVSEGAIVEIGTHEQLLRLRRRYYAMCLAQALDQASD